MPKRKVQNPHKGKSKRATKLALAERRKQVAEMAIQGHHQDVIAAKLGICQGSVSLDLKAVREQWLQSSLQDFDTLKAQELARLDAVASAAWEGWKRSQLPTKKEPDTQRPGDPAFLTQIRECAVAKLRVIGALQPKQTHVNLNANLMMAQVLATDEEPEPLTIEERIQQMVQRQPTEAERLKIERDQLKEQLGMNGSDHD